MTFTLIGVLYPYPWGIIIHLDGVDYCIITLQRQFHGHTQVMYNVFALFCIII